MRNAVCLSALVMLTACTYYYYPAPVTAPGGLQTQAESQTAPPPDCREFTQSVTIDGQPRQATGQACPQPDGTWKIR